MIWFEYVILPHNKIDNLIQEYSGLLTDSLQANGADGNRKPSYASLVGRGIILNYLIEHGWSPTKLKDLKVGKNGKPHIVGFKEFNISHSNDIILVGFNDSGPIGVDIQFHQKVDFSAFKGIFTTSEVKQINYSLTPIETFYNIWSSKEAVSKLLGLNLGESITNIKIFNKSFSFKDIVGSIYKFNLKGEYTLTLATLNTSDYEIRGYEL